MARQTVSRQRLWQIKMQQEGRCQRCGGQKDSAGKVYCQACERKSIDTSMRRYYERKAGGVCPRCGKRKPAKGRVLCRKCSGPA